MKALSLLLDEVGINPLADPPLACNFRPAVIVVGIETVSLKLRKSLKEVSPGLIKQLRYDWFNRNPRCYIRVKESGSNDRVVLLSGLVVSNLWESHHNQRVVSFQTYQASV